MEGHPQDCCVGIESAVDSKRLMGTLRRRQRSRASFYGVLAIAGAVMAVTPSCAFVIPLQVPPASSTRNHPRSLVRSSTMWVPESKPSTRSRPIQPLSIDWESLHKTENEQTQIQTTPHTGKIETEAASDPTAYSTSNLPLLQEMSNKKSAVVSRLDLWKRRLITKEDYKHLHKLSGSVFLISSLGLMGYGLMDLCSHGWTQSITRHGQPFVALLLLMLSSTLVQATSSVSMAFNYRKSQISVRNTFWSNAVVAVLGSVCALWVTPYYPAVLNGAFSRAFYLIMNTLGLVGMGDNAMRLKDLIASRQQHKFNNKNSNMTKFAYWKDALTYMMPIWIGLPFFLSMLVVFGIQHDRTFYLQLLQRPNHPHLHGGAVYANIMVAMGASYSSLIVTLRDKKLIGKRTEMTSLTAIMLAVAGSLYQSLRDPGTVSMFLGL